MATKINVATTTKGLPVPAGAVIIANIHFPKGELQADEEGVFNGEAINIVTADLIPFASKKSYQDSLGQDSLGKIKEIPSAYRRVLSEADYTALAGNNALGIVRGWIKDFIEAQPEIGVGNAEIVDLTVID